MSVHGPLRRRWDLLLGIDLDRDPEPYRCDHARPLERPCLRCTLAFPGFLRMDLRYWRDRLRGRY